MLDGRSPLVAIGDSLRAARAARRRLRRRVAVVAGLGIAVGATIILPPRPLLVWNASASAPMGFYAVGAPMPLRTGDMVIARVPEPWRMWAARRHYLPANVPLVKRVAAEPGDRVCAVGHRITVNGAPVAERRAVDGAGRPMPSWFGCVTLRHGALFLLMTDNAGSFDGRYFGPTEPHDIVGKATLLWRR